MLAGVLGAGGGRDGAGGTEEARRAPAGVRQAHAAVGTFEASAPPAGGVQQGRPVVT